MPRQPSRPKSGVTPLEVVVIEPAELDRLWNESWERYIKTVADKDYENPDRVATAKFLRQRCEI